MNGIERKLSEMGSPPRTPYAPFVEQNFILRKNTRGGLIKQWVSEIESFSSEYTSSGNWRAQEIIGAPKVFPNYGDRSGAWAPGRFNNMEFVVVKFPRPVLVSHLDIYETNIPGAVCQISGRVNGEWVILWQGEPNHTLPTQSRIFRPALRQQIVSNVFKIELNCLQLNTWPEIDCIELVGHTNFSETTTVKGPLANDMKMLFDSRHMFSDVTFIVEEKEIKAHKCILWSRCDVFRAMLSSQMTEHKTNTIKIVDFTYNVFIQLLEYIYTGSVDMSENNILGLYCAADKYNLPELRDLCVQELKCCLTVENVSQVLNTVYEMNESNVPLIKECVNFIKENSAQVIRGPTFESLPKELILFVLQAMSGESTVPSPQNDIERFIWTTNVTQH